MIQLIAIDLDGTLLTSNSEITSLSAEAIHRALNKGVEIVIATGRGHFDVRNLLKKWSVSPWIIGANGATIHKPDGAPFRTFPLKRSRAIEIIRWLENNHFYYEVFSEHAIYTPIKGRELIEIELDRLERHCSPRMIKEFRHSAVEQFKQFGFEYVRDYQEIEKIKQPVYNILAFSFDDKKLENGRRYFSTKNGIHVGDSGYHNFEIGDLHASKGNSLSILAHHLNINLENVAVIGDSANDLSMMKLAGVSVAMENASEEIKEICTMKTASHDEEGVAKTINLLLETGL